jgi:hypothetical protein
LVVGRSARGVGGGMDGERTWLVIDPAEIDANDPSVGQSGHRAGSTSVKGQLRTCYVGPSICCEHNRPTLRLKVRRLAAHLKASRTSSMASVGFCRWGSALFPEEESVSRASGPWRTCCLTAEMPGFEGRAVRRRDRVECRLLADCVEKLENRGALKFSQM